MRFIPLFFLLIAATGSAFAAPPKCRFEGKSILEKLVPYASVPEDRKSYFVRINTGTTKIPLTREETDYHADWGRRKDNFLKCVDAWERAQGQELDNLAEYVTRLKVPAKRYSPVTNSNARYLIDELERIAKTNPESHPGAQLSCSLPVGRPASTLTDCINTHISQITKHWEAMSRKRDETRDMYFQQIKRDVIGSGTRVESSSAQGPDPDDPLAAVMGRSERPSRKPVQ